jgi:hypothetical protein
VGKRVGTTYSIAALSTVSAALSLGISHFYPVISFYHDSYVQRRSGILRACHITEAIRLPII